MDDLIRKQAAIDALTTECSWIIYDEDGQLTPDGEEILGSLKNIPSAQQWIPCSERLPEKGVIVLTQTAKGYMTTNKRVDFDNHETWFWGGNYVAWMPLPSPYREEATE